MSASRSSLPFFKRSLNRDKTRRDRQTQSRGVHAGAGGEPRRPRASPRRGGARGAGALAGGARAAPPRAGAGQPRPLGPRRRGPCRGKSPESGNFGPSPPPPGLPSARPCPCAAGRPGSPPRRRMGDLFLARAGCARRRCRR